MGQFSFNVAWPTWRYDGNFCSSSLTFFVFRFLFCLSCFPECLDASAPSKRKSILKMSCALKNFNDIDLHQPAEVQFTHRGSCWSLWVRDGNERQRNFFGGGQKKHYRVMENVSVRGCRLGVRSEIPRGETIIWIVTWNICAHSLMKSVWPSTKFKETLYSFFVARFKTSNTG